MGRVKYDFGGEVALVTGAAAGMGLGAAKAFAEAGAKVVLSDINKTLLDQAVAEIRAGGGEATGIVCDVSDDAQVKALVDATVATYGRLDCAFNNAGIITPARNIADMDVAEYDRVMAINLRGVWSALKYEIIQMKKQGSGGAIVNNSSLAGKVGVAGRAQYVAAKHGMLGLTKSIALEVGGDGIRVNAICPGTIDTPMVRHMVETADLDTNLSKAAVPLKRLGTVEEIAQAVLWLCSDGSSYVIGEPLSVDAGVTIQ
jgi:NAD(P)-dependent dehydrogenase (short-subunit alcohol dehydrogenase family)